MNQGIYAIRNKLDGKQYIGQSTDMEGRRRHHFQKSANPRLYHAMKTFGKDNFEFIILELIEDRFQLVVREQYYYDLYAGNMYNRKEKAKVSWVNKVYPVQSFAPFRDLP